jgi:hypothetical protein
VGKKARVRAVQRRDKLSSLDGAEDTAGELEALDETGEPAEEPIAEAAEEHVAEATDDVADEPVADEPAAEAEVEAEAAAEPEPEAETGKTAS